MDLCSDIVSVIADFHIKSTYDAGRMINTSITWCRGVALCERLWHQKEEEANEGAEKANTRDSTSPTPPPSRVMRRVFTHSTVLSISELGSLSEQMLDLSSMPLRILVATRCHVDPQHYTLLCRTEGTCKELLWSNQQEQEANMKEHQSEVRHLASLLPKLQRIGELFYWGSHTIKHVELVGLKALRHIRDSFLNTCWAVESLTLDDLPALESIGSLFCYECESLEEVRLGFLPKLTSIGDNFMVNCPRLRGTLDISPLSALTTVGDNFLLSTPCTLSGFGALHSLTTVGLGFMATKGSVTTGVMEHLVLPPKLERIGELECVCFLQCTSLGFLDNRWDTRGALRISSAISEKKKSQNEQKDGQWVWLETVGPSFCSGTSLTEVHLSNLPSLAIIDRNFLAHCVNLKILTLERLPAVTKIHDKFCLSCSSLVECRLEDLPEVKSIGSDFLSQCSQLTSLRMVGFTNLKEIEFAEFFCFNTRIQHVDVSLGAPQVDNWVKEHVCTKTI